MVGELPPRRREAKEAGSTRDSGFSRRLPDPSTRSANQNWSERILSLRQRKEVQEVLRQKLTPIGDSQNQPPECAANAANLDAPRLPVCLSLAHAPRWLAQLFGDNVRQHHPRPPRLGAVEGGPD